MASKRTVEQSVAWWVICGVAVAMGCGGAARPSADGLSKEGAAVAARPIEVPETPRHAPRARVAVARGIQNPRGIFVSEDGSLLVASAGTGHPDNPMTSGLWRLVDRNGDGDFDGRVAILEGLRSANILHIVRRDEVFGMAAVAEGAGVVLATHAFFGSPTTIYRIDGDTVSEWASAHANLNALTYDPERQTWFAVSSSSDELVRVGQGERPHRVVKFPPLGDGQDSVPGYLRMDPRTGDVLVSLFTGSPKGEEGGDGTEILKGAGSIVRVHPESGAIIPLVTGLTAPTDFVVTADGDLYILEFCDGFLDPVETHQALSEGVQHGGFRRFSGRLLHVDRERGEVSVLAEGLDTPTNLTLHAGRLFMATGMGTPGRLIPGPGGPQPLDGLIERIALSDATP